MPIRRYVPLAAIAALVSACQGVPADYKPDPSLKSASVATLRGKIASACVITQRGRSSRSTGELQKGCGCYAGSTWKAMTPPEVTFYRENGYFSDATRPKAEAALKSCGLPA